MNETNEPVHHRQTTSAVDVLRTDTAGLRCPGCDYDLTGLTESRCPECGQAFDAAALRSGVWPATPWDTPGERFGFIRTLWMSLFHVRRLVAGFPDRHSNAAAWKYSFACLGIAVAIQLIAIAIFGSDMPSGLDCAIVALLASACGSAIGCEFLASAFVTGVLRGKPGCHFEVWRGINHYFGGYLILTSAAISVALEIPRPPQLLIAVPLVWWLFSQLIAVRARGGTIVDCLLCAILVPLAAAACIAPQALVAYMLIAALFRSMC